MTTTASPARWPYTPEAPVKCVVWDLDDTLWDGTLLEDRTVTLRPAVVAVIRALDSRGILHSVSSRNDHSAAMAQLSAFGLDEYFLCPQINWNPKSMSLRAIVEALNIGFDAVAFVDDQAVERDEVASAHPQVRCLGVETIPLMLDMPAFTPRFVTDDSRQRRAMMRADTVRSTAETEFTGPPDAFLASLEMIFSIRRAREEDLRRAEELTIRTNQLNTSGRTYTYDELSALARSPDHLLLVAGLEDRYGTYGTIGLTLASCEAHRWTIRLLLMSCRVMDRGVGTMLLTHLMQRARAAGARLQAEFTPTGRNRMMFVTYRFSGFRPVDQRGATTVLEHDLSDIPQFPPYVTLRIVD